MGITVVSSQPAIVSRNEVSNHQRCTITLGIGLYRLRVMNPTNFVMIVSIKDQFIMEPDNSGSFRR